MAEPIAGKCHLVKYQSRASKGYLPRLVAGALTLLHTQFALVEVLWFADLEVFSWLSQGNSGGWNWCPSGCMFAAMQECYCCFQNEP